MLKPNQVKPEVIGYERVFNNGDIGNFTLTKLAIAKAIREDKEEVLIHKNGKQKFRPVYK